MPARFAAPAVLLLLIFYAAPIIAGFISSFTNWSTYRSDRTFTGLENFRDLAGYGTITHTLGITLKFAVCFTIVANLVALGLALLLENLRG